MKRLFTIPCDGLFWVEEENAVYSIFNLKTKELRFFDACGNSLPNYKRIDRSDEDTFEYKPPVGDLIYNQYGVACGDSCLVDEAGNEIPDTKLNLEDACGGDDRYFTFALISEEQSASIDRCGTAAGILLNVYDTKTRQYVIKGVPECKLDVSFYDGEPEVILAAADMVPNYDRIRVEKTGTILAYKNGDVTVYNFYDN